MASIDREHRTYREPPCARGVRARRPDGSDSRLFRKTIAEAVEDLDESGVWLLDNGWTGPDMAMTFEWDPDGERWISWGLWSHLDEATRGAVPGHGVETMYRR